jgi:hypothetical protein
MCAGAGEAVRPVVPRRALGAAGTREAGRAGEALSGARDSVVTSAGRAGARLAARPVVAGLARVAVGTRESGIAGTALPVPARTIVARAVHARAGVTSRAEIAGGAGVTRGSRPTCFAGARVVRAGAMIARADVPPVRPAAACRSVRGRVDHGGPIGAARIGPSAHARCGVGPAGPRGATPPYVGASVARRPRTSACARPTRVIIATTPRHQPTRGEQRNSNQLGRMKRTVHWVAPCRFARSQKGVSPKRHARSDDSFLYREARWKMLPPCRSSGRSAPRIAGPSRTPLCCLLTLRGCRRHGPHKRPTASPAQT